MTLAAKLKELEGTQVKIGAKHGTAFFWAGVVTPATLDILNKKSKESYKSLLSTIEMLHEHITTSPMTKYDLERLEYRTERYEKLTNFRDHWKDIGEREVIETFMADIGVEPFDTTVLLVDGYENGTIWMVSDVEKGATA